MPGVATPLWLQDNEVNNRNQVIFSGRRTPAEALRRGEEDSEPFSAPLRNKYSIMNDELARQSSPTAQEWKWVLAGAYCARAASSGHLSTPSRSEFRLQAARAQFASCARDEAGPVRPLQTA